MLRILFLENQPGRLDRIRSAFDAAAGSFDLVFVSDGDGAVQAVSGSDVDVLFFGETIVENKRLSFLAEVRERSVRPPALIMVSDKEPGRHEVRVSVSGADHVVRVTVDAVEQYPVAAVWANHLAFFRVPSAGMRSREWDLLLDQYWMAVVGAQVSGVAHEINNKLTGAVSYTELLIQQTADDAVKRDLYKILKSVEQGANIIGNLLSFARREAAAISVQSVNTAVDRVIALRSYGLRSKRITVTREYGDLPAVFMDNQQLQQLILSVMLNAEQAVAAAGSGQGKIAITTRYRKEDRTVEVVVADNGPGIPPDVFPRLFEPFFSTIPGRAGLGLSEARRIAEAQGGLVRAERTGGPGAVFTIELPTVAAAARH